MKKDYTDFSGLIDPANGTLSESQANGETGAHEATRDEKERELSNLTIDDFKKLKNSKETFVMKFSHAGYDGTLSTVEHGIYIVLPGIKMDSEKLAEGLAIMSKTNRNPHYRDRNIERSYPVKVASVDEESKTVTLEQDVEVSVKNKILALIKYKLDQSKAGRKAVENEVREEVNRICNQELAKELERMNPRTAEGVKKRITRDLTVKKMWEHNIDMIIARAYVTEVGRNGCKVELCNCGLLGYIPANFWNYGFVYDMRKYVTAGEYVKVCILAPRVIGGEGPMSGERRFMCSRAMLLDNPWENLRVKAGDTVMIKCVKTERHNYFGEIAGLELPIYCEYPDHAEECKVEQGKTYVGYIYRINPKTKTIMARTLRLATEDVEA